MWGEGCSSSVIADTLHMTRNAVIGKLHRLGYSDGDRERPKERQKKTYVKRNALTKLFNAPDAQSYPVPPDRKPKLPDPSAPVPLNLTLMDLKPESCRWPAGDGPYFFCGHPKIEHSSYCAYHFKESKPSSSMRPPATTPYGLALRRQRLEATALSDL